MRCRRTRRCRPKSRTSHARQRARRTTPSSDAPLQSFACTTSWNTRRPMIECHVAPSPLGHILYRAEGDSLTGLFFVGQKHFPAGIAEPVLSDGATVPRVIAAAREQVDEYFTGGRRAFAVKLRLNGTAF